MSIIPIKNQLVEKYVGIAKTFILSNKHYTPEFKQIIGNMSKQQKVLLTKIVKNINIICKMPKKQVVEYLKTAPAYQQVLGDLYFTSSINNYRFIVNQSSNEEKLILKNASTKNKCIFTNQCYKIDYRIEFTISNIATKKVLKPIICLIFRIDDQTNKSNVFSVYLNLDKFSQFRYKVAEAMKNLYTFEMKTLF